MRLPSRTISSIERRRPRVATAASTSRVTSTYASSMLARSTCSHRSASADMTLHDARLYRRRLTLRDCLSCDVPLGFFRGWHPDPGGVVRVVLGRLRVDVTSLVVSYGLHVHAHQLGHELLRLRHVQVPLHASVPRGVVDRDEPAPLLHRQGDGRIDAQTLRLDLRVEAVQVEVDHDPSLELRRVHRTRVADITRVVVVVVRL